MSKRNRRVWIVVEKIPEINQLMEDITSSDYPSILTIGMRHRWARVVFVNGATLTIALDEPTIPVDRLIDERHSNEPGKGTAGA